MSLSSTIKRPAEVFKAPAAGAILGASLITAAVPANDAQADIAQFHATLGGINGNLDESTMDVYIEADLEALNTGDNITAFYEIMNTSITLTTGDGVLNLGNVGESFISITRNNSLTALSILMPGLDGATWDVVSGVGDDHDYGLFTIDFFAFQDLHGDVDLLDHLESIGDGDFDLASGIGTRNDAVSGFQYISSSLTIVPAPSAFAVTGLVGGVLATRRRREKFVPDELAA